MSSPIIGIDIHHAGVSAVLLQIGLRKTQLLDTVSIRFSEIPDIPAAITSCLETLSKTVPIGGALTAVSIPSGDSFYRNLAVPFTKRQDIEKILPYELDSLLPVSSDQVTWDTQILQTGTARSYLLTVSVIRDRIAGILAAVEPFQLKICRVLPGLFSLGVVIQNLPDTPPNWILADWNHNVLSLCLALAGQISVIRRIRLPDRAPVFPEKIAQEIHHTILTAEQFLARPIEIERLFLNHDSGSISTAGLKNLSTTGDLSEIPIEFVDLYSENRWFHHTGTSAEWDPSCLNRALAGAWILEKSLPSPDLRDHSRSFRNLWGDYRSRWRETALLTTIALLLACFGTWLDNSLQQDTLDRLNQVISAQFAAAFPDGTPMIDPIQQLEGAIRDLSRNELLQADKTTPSLLEVLQEISSRTPRDRNVRIRRLVYGKERVQLNGITPDFETMSIFQQQVEQSRLFESVTLVSSHQEKAEDRVHFVMDLTASARAPE